MPRQVLPRITTCRACPAQREPESSYCIDCNALPEKDRAAKANAFYQKQGIAAYGGKCSCCGETEEQFLTLEHEVGVPRLKNGRRVTGTKAWMILKKAGWPAGHTVLCYNCNCAKGAYGVCPHKRVTWSDKPWAKITRKDGRKE